MHESPLVLRLTILMVILVVACAVAPLHFDGHVLCSLANGTAEVPVENAEVKLLEEDMCWLGVFDCDDPMASTKTDAKGAFNLDGESSEMGSLEPYLVIKACRNESSCNVKRFPESRVNVQNHTYFMDNEFCQYCKGGGKCQSA